MYAVVDTETTGLNPSVDRIIELAIIGLDAEGNREWEWCSLINPERDTGHGLAVRIHQIHKKDVAGAPTFEAFAGHIISLLKGRAIIAHNAKFDLGMLASEYARLGVTLPALPQVCTADLARDCGFRPWRLDNCCAILGIEVEGMHHALADARATWSLSQHLLDFSHVSSRQGFSPDSETVGAWPSLPAQEQAPVLRPIMPCRPVSVSGASFGSNPSQSIKQQPAIATFSVEPDDPLSSYIAAVELVIEDREVSADQTAELDALQEELGLTGDQVHSAKTIFLCGLAASMWDDGEISKHEQFDLEAVARALELSKDDIQYALTNPLEVGLLNDEYVLQLGAKVVFTGEMSLSRSDWKKRAEDAGLKVIGSVSGRTDFLVVPSSETGSTKSEKARKLGVRVVSEQRFLRMIKRLEKSVL